MAYIYDLKQLHIDVIFDAALTQEDFLLGSYEIVDSSNATLRKIALVPKIYDGHTAPGNTEIMFYPEGNQNAAFMVSNTYMSNASKYFLSVRYSSYGYVYGGKSSLILEDSNLISRISFKLANYLETYQELETYYEALD